MSSSQRDEIEAVLREWDALERKQDAPPIIDFDCHPEPEREPAPNRIAVLEKLTRLREGAAAALAPRLDADLAFLRALLGERPTLDDYIRATQDCAAAGWPEEHVRARGDEAREALAELGISWGADTPDQQRQAEGVIDVADAADAIRDAATGYEPAIRQATGSDASYRLSVETTDVRAYWAYWLDGAGQDVRLRLNLRNAKFTRVSARQFALHEVLGHGLQSASLAARAASEDVPWVRLLSVHAPHQVMLEGLAQAWPLFVTPDDKELIARVRVAHYMEMVRAQLHRAINGGASAADCAAYALDHVPWWDGGDVADALADASNDAQLRSYLWAYPAGIDWFAALAEADVKVSREVLHAAYREPLTPTDLAALWPDGPPIGGPGSPVRLRHPSVP